ncbi:MAG: hypothetical protein LBH40_01245 [Alphaproteobacteria bacterium]|jgi:hypothetical protein|nr:hypothetical protein [Alphaproteobacteria bacterium]
MFIKKQIVILGSNQAILTDLITNLLEQNYTISIVIEDSESCLFIKDTLNRISYFNIHDTKIKDILNKADVIINTFFMISPSSIKKIKKNLSFYKNILKLIECETKVIDILPLLNDDRVRSFYKDIKKYEKYAEQNFNNHLTLYTPLIFSQQDSLIQDIEELYKISNKIFRYKENFSYIDKNSLIEAILNLIENNTYQKADFEIGSYKSTNIDYINDNVIIDTKQLHEISSISWWKLSLLSFLYKKEMPSFKRKYLYFIKACRKTSRSALNLETLNIKKHSLLFILNKYKDNNQKPSYEDLEEYEMY